MTHRDQLTVLPTPVDVKEHTCYTEGLIYKYAKKPCKQ